MLKFTELPDGRLQVSITPEGKTHLKEMIADESSYDQIWKSLMESSEQTEYRFDGETFNGMLLDSKDKLWWMPDYPRINELHELSKGRSIFFS